MRNMGAAGRVAGHKETARHREVCGGGTHTPPILPTSADEQGWGALTLADTEKCVLCLTPVSRGYIDLSLLLYILSGMWQSINWK